MGLIGYNFMHANPPWQIARLARYLRVAPDHIYSIVDQLVDANMLIESGDTTITLLPRQDIECLKVDSILAAVRSGDANAAPTPRDDRLHDEVDGWISRNLEARAQVFGQLSLRDLVRASMRERGTTTTEQRGMRPVG
jgi:hypothetical protein